MGGNQGHASNQGGAGGSQNAPAVSVFQFDDSGIGDLPSAVNLFRGDVNLARTLVSLPGRNDDSPLSVDVTINYGSNVTEAARHWNRTHPTGVLGLGWDLPLTYITASDTGLPTTGARHYTLHEGGTAQELVAEAMAPFLFAMDGRLAEKLKDGAGVPETIRKAFHEHGLRLSESATVNGQGPWQVDDATHRALFTLMHQDGNLNAFDGGESFQVKAYNFSKVLYYPKYERWVLTGGDGIRREFGGTEDPPEPGKTRQAHNNSIAWQVWWTDDSEAPAWRGASAETAGQVQVAGAWYMTTVRSLFDETAEYAYTTVTQPVGSKDGLPYTKAVYLHTLTGALGHEVIFDYGDKLWSADPEAPREYADPYKAAPDDSASPYQAMYETKFLQTLHVTDGGGTALYTIDLNYAPRPDASGRTKEVANVTGRTGTLKGDTFKRFLTGVTMRDRDGLARPGLAFDYYLEEMAGWSPGALRTITFPEGAAGSYTYDHQSLDICERDVELTPDGGAGEMNMPQVFFGPDYTVACFQDPNSQQVALQIRTWTGEWQVWRPFGDGIVIDDQAVDTDTLNVLTGADILVLQVNRNTTADKALFVFQRDALAPANWHPATIDGHTAAKNTPTLTFATKGQDVVSSLGDAFFLVSQMAQGKGGDVYRYAYNPVTRDWTSAAEKRQDYTHCVADAAYYALLDHAGTVSLRYRDGDRRWHEGGSVQIGLDKGVQPEQLALASGGNVLAVSQLTNWGRSWNEYKFFILNWGPAFHPALAVTERYTDDFDESAGTRLTWKPQVAADRLIGVAGHLWRFNGRTWLPNDSLCPANPRQAGQQRYGYGPDYAVAVFQQQGFYGECTAYVLAYDPERDGESWTAQAQKIDKTWPQNDTALDNWPRVNAAYAVVGPYVYDRGSATNWERVFSGDAHLVTDLRTQVPSGHILDSASLINAGPNYLAYNLRQGENVTGVQVTLLGDGGTVADTKTFSDEAITSPVDAPAYPGASPAGIRMFAAYPAKAGSFSQATKLQLHRYTHRAVTGPITHNAVKRLSITNGFEAPIHTSYVPEKDTAACDPSGTVTKYYRTRTYPGASDPEKPRYGSTVKAYHNGTRRHESHPPSTLLDGKPIKVETFNADGELRKRVTNSYAILDEIAVQRPEGWQARALAGGVAVLAKETRWEQGVEGESHYTYTPDHAPASIDGSPAVKTAHYPDGAGTDHTVIKRSVPAVCVYPALWPVHVLGPRAQMISERKRDAAAAVTETAEAQTFQYWKLDDGLAIPATEASFAYLNADTSEFPFDQYKPGSRAPDGWCLKSRVTARSSAGKETEGMGADGVPAATLYDNDDLFAVATCGNARLDGFAFYAFEAYESAQRWTREALDFDDGDAVMGQRSGRLKAGGHLSTRVQPRRAETYVIACWYKTPTDFEEKSATALAARVRVGGQPPQTHSKPMPSSDGEWRYLLLPVPIDSGQSGGETIVLDASVTNGGETDLHIDGVRVAPLASDFTGMTFEPLSRAVTGRTGLSGLLHWVGQDRAFRHTVAADRESGAVDLSLSFQSRQGNAAASFDAGSPNAEVSVIAADGGTVETFRDGGAWTRRWQASDGADHWHATDGALVHTRAGTDRLTAQDKVPETPFAVYFEVQAGQNTVLTLEAGDIEIAFADDHYQARQGDDSWPLLAQPPRMARHWLMVVGHGVTLFFGDGQLLYSRQTTPADGDLCLRVGGKDTALRHLGVLHGARAKLVYKDALGRERQTHELGCVQTGADTLVAQTVRDALGREIASTRPAPGRFGSGADKPVAAYLDGFVHVKAFLDRLDGDWKMSGDVVDYYRGQTVAGLTRPDDAGYPYNGKRYERVPDGKIVEEGEPGAQHAIDLTKPAEQRQTRQYAFGVADHADAGAGTADQKNPAYFVDTMVTAVKNETVAIKDKRGVLVGKSYRDPKGQDLVRTRVADRLENSDDGPRELHDVALPKSFSGGENAQAGAEAFHSVTQRDALGRDVSSDTPDAAPVAVIYDDAGRERFRRPSQDGSQPWYIYTKYDVLGREIETGIVEADWDRAHLESVANDPAFPQHGAEARRVIDYDGDGSDPALIGRTWHLVAHNPADGDAGSCEVRETFSYSRAGEVASVTTQVSGAAETTQTFAYYYNALGELVRIDYPEDAPVDQVHYTRNAFGRIVAIGTRPGGSEFAAYRYLSDGTLVSQEFAGQRWQRLAVPASDGSVKTITARRSDGNGTGGNGTGALTFDYGYSPDGLVTSRKVTDELGSLGTLDQRFEYDAQRRYSTGHGRGIESVTAYDANSNILALDWGDTSLTFDLVAGTDRTKVLTQGNQRTAFEYNAAGQMTGGRGRRLSYDRCTGQTRRVTAPGADVRFVYNGNDRRVVKQSVDGAFANVISIYGGERNGKPLLRYDGNGWQALILGPGGLAALCSAETVRYPFTDSIGSTWAVVDKDGICASFAYSPFGRLIQGNAADFPYLFQSREWDAGTALYNYDARLYDPILCRFLSPDPAHQFASPYTFLANAPLNLTDPTGEISTAARIGLGAGLVLLGIVAGVATIATGGAASFASVGGFMAGAAALGFGTVAGAAISAGGYALVHSNEEFSWKQFGIAAGVGAAAGLVSTGTGFAANWAISTVASRAATAAVDYAVARGASEGAQMAARYTTQIGIELAGGAAVGAGLDTGARFAKNVFMGKDLSNGLWLAAVTGAVAGGVAGAGSGWGNASKARVNPGFSRRMVDANGQEFGPRLGGGGRILARTNTTAPGPYGLRVRSFDQTYYGGIEQKAAKILPAAGESITTGVVYAVFGYKSTQTEDSSGQNTAQAEMRDMMALGGDPAYRGGRWVV